MLNPLDVRFQKCFSFWLTVADESLLEGGLFLWQFWPQFLFKICDVLSERLLPELENRWFFEMTAVSF